jgi:hypothetical protein
MLSVEVMKNEDLPKLFDIYTDPYVKKIEHDYMRAAVISHPNATYLSAKVNDEIVGAFLAIKTSPLEIEWHSLLTKKALKYSRELGELFIEWAFSIHLVSRITANIIEGFDTVMNYAKKLGMKLEGIKRDAVFKNGKLLDLYIYGITKKDRGL